MDTLPANLIPTIFHEPWWLKLSCGERYREVTVSENNTVIGRLPYLHTKYLRHNIMRMPPLTQVLGPATFSLGKYTSRVTRDLEITAQLIRKLPRFSHVHMRLHWAIDHTLAFKAAGFQTGVDYTVRIAPVAPDVLWKQMRDKNRNSVRRAQESHEIIEISEAETFIDLYTSNIIDRGSSNVHSCDFLRPLIAEAVNRGRARIIAAIDQSKVIQAAILTVWDDNSEYYLMSTRSKAAHNGCINLLLWHGISHAHRLGLSFDTAGLHVKGSNLPNLLLTTSFGGSITPNYFVTKSSPVVQMASLARKLAGQR